MREWLFRHLFRQDYEHMRHLVSDIIRLERDKKMNITTDSNSFTYYQEIE